MKIQSWEIKYIVVMIVLASLFLFRVSTLAAQPSTVVKCYMVNEGGFFMSKAPYSCKYKDSNLRLTFDAAGKLINAEVNK